MGIEILTTNERRLAYRLLYALVLSDERMAFEEIAFIRLLATRLGLTDQDREVLTPLLSKPVDPKALSAQLSMPARRLVLNEMLDAAWADKNIDRREAKFIYLAMADLLIE